MSTNSARWKQSESSKAVATTKIFEQKIDEILGPTKIFDIDLSNIESLINENMFNRDKRKLL